MNPNTWKKFYTNAKGIQIKMNSWKKANNGQRKMDMIGSG